ncbi:putative transcription factor WD40-like family [Helianthus annuus]|uniref:WD repeat-containing protein 76 n=1 Tax=Helianthus annuus TaxID=4232 RepID=A0A251UPT4_HELAN|nr:WD repeat-containing protein 76 [Helianthus annuus]KAF5805090.1 putative transcription factor WD40-like family [Helianthus annuus]KAJ0583923.1 putative transcription factor WD40-like family [Helianthus annuus]KAJ0921950.1 putative transcription factor WD40-like family [Helianthus annuus]
MSSSQRITEYERKRLENIKRNDELLASLKIKSKLADLSSSAKRHRAETKSYKLSPEKKARSETPIVIRRSLRTQGKAPDLSGLKDDFSEPTKKSTTLKSQVSPNQSPKKLEPISMRDANTCSESDELLVNKILSVCKGSGLDGDGDGDGERKCRVRVSVDLESMELAPENVARVVPNRILSVKFFPSAGLRMVVVGNKFGNLGFWNVDLDNEDGDGDGIYLYQPHPSPVSAILIHPFSLNKIITSCYGGLVRSLDVEKETFGLVYSTEHAIFSMAQQPDDANNLYLGEGHGVVNIWDERSARSSFSWELHDSRINTIDFNPENTNMMATSSSDGTACIWDLRKIGKSKPKSLKVITRERAVHSAYFSPSGDRLATTSLDDKIGVLGGANYEDEFMLYHYNQTGRWLSSFKGVWGWDDSYIFIGNMKRGVDVISTLQQRLVTTLESPHMTAIPCRFDPHPFYPGMLAGATSGGQVYIWT